MAKGNLKKGKKLEATKPLTVVSTAPATSTGKPQVSDIHLTKSMDVPSAS
jgi:hypothetical protein